MTDRIPNLKTSILQGTHESMKCSRAASREDVTAGFQDTEGDLGPSH
jgi:hypothetical protein